MVFDETGAVLRSVTPSPGATLEHALGWDPTGTYVVYAERNGATASLVVLDVSTGATTDHLTLTVSGSKNYAADADLTSGNLRVVKDQLGVSSVSGAGTFPGVNAATATTSISLNRIWIFPVWLGSVRVDDGATHFDGFVLFPSVSPTADGAAVNGGWLQFSSFPWGSGSLSLRVRDLS